MANNRELSQFASFVSADSGRVGINTDTFPDARDSLIVAPPSGQTDVFFTIKTLSTNGNTRLQFADPDDTNVGDISYTHSNNAMVFKTADTERLHIDNDGQLVINRPSGAILSTSTSKLEVYNSTENLIWVANSTAATGQDAGIIFAPANNVYGGKIVVTSDEDFSTGANRTAHMAFYTRKDGTASEKLRITSDGLMGLGTSSPESYVGGGENLVIADSSDAGMTIASGTSNSGTINFADGASGDARYRGRLEYSHSLDALDILTAATTQIRITSDGKVAIGTLSPDSLIHGKVSSGGATLTLESTATSGEASVALKGKNSSGTVRTATIKYDNADKYRIAVVSNIDLDFETNDTGRMKITSDGTVRIGNSLSSNAAGRFQVVEERSSGDDNDCNAYFETNRLDWNIKTYYNRSGTHYHIVFVEQGTERGGIYGSDGSNVNYNQGSDYRWKENIVEMTGTEGIEICKRLKPSKYNWIANREATGEINTVDGFIAHEVVEAGVLGAVSGEKDAVNEDGSIKGQQLDYGQMTPVLSAGIKGLIAKIETLETRVSALENP